jgi:hypothetical protein
MEPQRGKDGRFVGKTRAPKVGSDSAYVFLELDRRSGEVTVDAELSTPMETWAMLEWAAAEWRDRLRIADD